MKIYVIIVTYNGSQWIDKCFGTLINSTIPLKILAIDNASTDGTPETIREKFPNVEVIETGANLGFGKANNIGLKRALEENADYVFLLNQDAWVKTDTIDIMINCHKKNPDYDLLSPMHLNGTNSSFDLYFSFYLKNIKNSQFISDLYFRRLQDIYEIDFAPAAAWLITKKCLQKIGGFDPLFYHYGEDIDFINRLKYNGLKLGIVTSAKINHDRNCRPINDISIDKKRRITNFVVGIKNINRPFFLNLLLFFKSEFKELFRLIFFQRDMRRLKIEISSILGAISHFSRIKKSRAESKKVGAFLNFKN